MAKGCGVVPCWPPVAVSTAGIKEKDERRETELPRQEAKRDERERCE